MIPGENFFAFANSRLCVSTRSGCILVLGSFCVSPRQGKMVRTQYSVLVDSTSITWLSATFLTGSGQGPFPPPALPGFTGTASPPPSAPAASLPRGRGVGYECPSSPRAQTSLVAYCLDPGRAAITTPVEPQVAVLVPFTRDVGLPRYCGESASTSALSGPARCSLALRPARTADPPKGPFPEVLQTIRCLLIRFRCFRVPSAINRPIH